MFNIHIITDKLLSDNCYLFIFFLLPIQEFYPSRDYWNDNSTYEQIFGQNFAGSFPNVKNSVASIRDSNQSRILATDVYTDDNNHLTSIKLHCKCGYWKNKETWNSRF